MRSQNGKKEKYFKSAKKLVLQLDIWYNLSMLWRYDMRCQVFGNIVFLSKFFFWVFICLCLRWKNGWIWEINFEMKMKMWNLIPVRDSLIIGKLRIHFRIDWNVIYSKKIMKTSRTWTTKFTFYQVYRGDFYWGFVCNAIFDCFKSDLFKAFLVQQ